MVLTIFNGVGVGFGFGTGCGFGIGWGFGGSSLQTLGLGVGGGCGVGVGVGWGYGAAYGTRYFDSTLRFEGFKIEQRKEGNRFHLMNLFRRNVEKKKLESSQPEALEVTEEQQ